MNDDKLNKILEKLRKLTDLKESAMLCGEEGEANAAASAISRLLLEYDLTLADIPKEQKEKEPIGIEDVPYCFIYRYLRWYWNLIHVLAQHNNCIDLRHSKFNDDGTEEIKYEIVGRPKNREIVLYLISFLAHQFIGIGKRKYQVYKNNMNEIEQMPISVGKYMDNFLYGCTIGLESKLQAERSSDTNEKVTALVKTSEHENKEFIEKRMNVKYARERNRQWESEIVRAGMYEGFNVNINRGLKEKAIRKINKNS